MKGPIPSARLRASFEAGRLDPVAVAEASIAAAKALDRQDPPLGAFIAYTPELARTQAEASAARYRAGTPLSPLDGVPIALKDMLDLKGLPTTDGTTWRNDPASSDSPLVTRLVAAGAVIIGKTSLHEIGLGATGVNPRHVTARNPVDPSRMTGGSSSGSGAAVGAGICPIALGSDAGGSVRIPAALCGVYGLKPTFGRIPAVGAALLCASLDHIGPLGASVEDLAIFYDALAGPHPGDEASISQPLPRPAFPLPPRDLRHLKVAYDPAFGADADAPVAAAFAARLDALRRAGATVTAVSLPDAALAQQVGYVTLGVEAAASQRDHLRTHRAHYGWDSRLLLAMGARITGAEYLHAQHIRARIRRTFGALLAEHDVFLSPTVACVAPEIHPEALVDGEVNPAINDRLSRYSFLANLTGFPSLSMPAEQSPEGLPTSLMLMARPWAEADLLAWALAIDVLTPAQGEPKRAVDLMDRLGVADGA